MFEQIIIALEAHVVMTIVEQGYEAPSIGCPLCGADLVKRQNRTKGNFFYGCSNYPQCTGTVSLTAYERAVLLDIGEDPDGFFDYDSTDKPPH